MKDVRWIINRLKAMEPQEVIWRLQERQLQRRELKTIYVQNKPVTDIPLPKELSKLCIDINRFSVNWDNKVWSRFEKLDLFGIFDYNRYKKNGMQDFKRVTNGQKNHFPKRLT